MCNFITSSPGKIQWWDVSLIPFFFVVVRNRRMRRIVFSGVFILLCLLSGKSLRKQIKKRENYLRDSRIAVSVEKDLK